LEEESNSTKVTIVLDLALEKKARQFEVATNFGKTAHGCCSAPTAIATLATGVVDSAKKKNNLFITRNQGCKQFEEIFGLI
ncbi:hypothetical protein EE612_046260, partial [Oryza sativa]